MSHRQDPERRRFGIIALTPPALPDASLAIAASRAGETGVLDLEYTEDVAVAERAIERLVRYGRGLLGVKLSLNDERLFRSLADKLPQSIKLAIVAQPDLGALPSSLKRLEEKGIDALVECTSVEEARAAEDAGAGGVIAKGHESAGRVGEETAFVLLQRLLTSVSIPVWAQGGIGEHTAAACYAVGAAGVVLDSQLYLLRESPVPEPVRSRIASMDGSETACLGREMNAMCRVYSRADCTVAARLNEEAHRLSQDGDHGSQGSAGWFDLVRKHAGWGDPAENVWLLGEDAGASASLARRYVTVGGALQAIRAGVREHVALAGELRSLDAGSPLASAHGTLYPIVQGPMTRVSDVPDFALSVAEGGGLPMLALALMPGQAVRGLLAETRARLGEKPWGVGILGFVPIELREEQLQAIREFHPAFALIAGGRPEQAIALEEDGIATYLHVPSPSLLRLFLERGARRFVFEGMECGGHVGPRSSFALWEGAIEVLLERLPQDKDRCADYHVLFAGGIHDSTSAAMVAALSATLAARGVRVGVLMGSAYLYTREAVESGAIVQAFQDEAVRCQKTTLLNMGPGYSIRCAETGYLPIFREERKRLEREGRHSDDIRLALEGLSIGRLRIAAKGLTRREGAEGNGKPPFVRLSEEEQRSQGLYMIGQVAAARNDITTVRDMHHEVSVRSSELLAALPGEEPPPDVASRPSDVAIIGMSCLLPGASNLEEYWRNILGKTNSVKEVPPDRWDWRLYYDPDPAAKDKVCSKWGGFIDPISFDPMAYGIPPASLSSIEPLHLLTLEAVRAALKDAGYQQREFVRDRTAVILGAGGAGDLGQLYGFRSFLPHVLGAGASGVLDGLGEELPEWTEDSFPGILTNVAAGRVANRFDLGGANYTVDAACASSLAAINLAVRELETGASDMVITGGADTIQSPFAFLSFSKTHALSPTGRCRTFDEKADGIAISEGIAILVLKRLADAERDGDRIYAVIKAVAASSDGRDKSLTAPRPEGQALALQRAYAKAGISPATVGLIEAHGTGTVAGDQAELRTLKRVFGDTGAATGCAVGSVKSMIGHTKNAAGAAGMIKAALALYHGALPPTLGVERPTPLVDLSEGPLYINTEARPWVRGDAPRRAGVSAFGFGGTNFHAVLEEYVGDYLSSSSFASPSRDRAVLCLWAKGSRAELIEATRSVEKTIQGSDHPPLADVGLSLWKAYEADSASAENSVRLAIVAESTHGLLQKLPGIQRGLETGVEAQALRGDGVYFSEAPLAAGDGKLAFLFPGQGSQRVNMLIDLAVDFRKMRDCFENADRTLLGTLPSPLSAHVYPPPAFSDEERKAQQDSLTQTNVAQPAIGAASLGVFQLLKELGVQPDMLGGHSYGELVALCAAGVFGADELMLLSEARGRFMKEAAGSEPGGMAAVKADAETILAILGDGNEVVLANHNAPKQVVLSGNEEGLSAAIDLLKAAHLPVSRLGVACAFHSPLVTPAKEELARFMASFAFKEQSLPVFSNTTCAPYPDDPESIKAQLAAQLASPVRFVEEVEAMYEAGARIFLEVGPGNVLTGLVDQILSDRPHAAISTDQPGRSSSLQLLHVLARLAVEGASLDLSRLYPVMARLSSEDGAWDAENPPEKSAGKWLVDGGHVWEAGAAPPSRAARPAASIAPAAQPAGGQTLATIAAPGGSGGVPLEGGNAGGVMREYHRLMDRFLETQQKVMLAYLQGGQRSASRAVNPLIAPERPAAISSPAEHGGDPASHKSDVQKAESKAPAGEPTGSDEDWFPGEEDLTRQLLRLASERTGYPPEMLGLDLDLEADLGIDSIKRVEILGNLQRQYPRLVKAIREEEMDKLIASRTLRVIVQSLLKFASAAEPSPRPPARETAELSVAGSHVAPEPQVVRYLPAATVAPPIEPLPIPKLDGVMIITDDEGGIAGAVADRLSAAGNAIVLLRQGPAGENGPRFRTMDLTSPEDIRQTLRVLREEYSGIIGLVHLSPLGWPGRQTRTTGEPAQRLKAEVEGFFLLVRELEAGFKDGAREVAYFLTATSLGGRFGTEGARLSPEVAPFQSALGGLAKTLAQEWTDARVKVVDLDPSEPAQALANVILNELLFAEGPAEVGYVQGKRFLPDLRPVPIGHTEALALDQSSVLLLTGGARGITGQIALHLARRYQPTLVLVGRSPLPPEEENTRTAGLEGQDLREALIGSLRAKGSQPRPAQVESELARLRREREIRENLAAMRNAGARVDYRQVDVGDEAAFTALIDALYQEYSRLDGVLHGAGVIEDKLVKDKLPESFNRVFETKVNSALALSRKLRPDGLGFLVFFSSVAARFGNRGQADYTAANEYLNKLAQCLDEAWPCRVVSVNWGPWAGAGMVSPGLQEHFARQGVGLIPLAEGCESMERELAGGNKGQAEVVIAAGLPPTSQAGLPRADFPMLADSRASRQADGSLQALLTLDLDRDLYLRDHRLDGKPVLPMAAAMNILAESAALACPDLKVIALSDLKVLGGVVMEEARRDVRVRASIARRAEASAEVEVSIVGDGGRLHYQARAVMAPAYPEERVEETSCHMEGSAFPFNARESYEKWLFQGPLFQGLSEISRVDAQSISGILLPSSPLQLIAGVDHNHWLIDPVLVDSGLQLVILWARLHRDETPLPTGFRVYKRFRVSDGPVECRIRIHKRPEPSILEADLFFLDGDERLIASMEGLEVACTRALNRIAGKIST